MYVLYKITCSENGKVYVGYTSKTAEERFQSHLLNARWKKKTALYDAVRCYGNDAFAVEMLLECESHPEACEHEIRLIKEFNSVLPGGYNMTHGGDGVPLTEEQREAANAKKRGVCYPKQLEANLRRKGQKASEETRAKLSAIRKGRKQNPEWVRKRVESFRRTQALKQQRAEVA
jgi:group I intron endonuclease